MIGTCFVPKGIINPDAIYLEKVGTETYIVFQNQVKEIRYKLRRPDNSEGTTNDNSVDEAMAHLVLARIRNKLRFSPPLVKGWIDLRLTLSPFIEETDKDENIDNDTDETVPDEENTTDEISDYKETVDELISKILKKEPTYVPTGFQKSTNS